VETFNGLIENRDEILQGYKEIINTLTDTAGLDIEYGKLQSECEVVVEMLRKCVDENAHSALNQQEYNQRYNALVQRYETTKKGLESINNKRLERSAKRES
jgi:predicted nuclease with TOPRIM domain